MSQLPSLAKRQSSQPFGHCLGLRTICNRRTSEASRILLHQARHRQGLSRHQAADEIRLGLAQLAIGAASCSRRYRKAPTLTFVMRLSRMPDAFKLEKKLPSSATLWGPHHASELMASVINHHLYDTSPCTGDPLSGRTAKSKCLVSSEAFRCTMMHSSTVVTRDDNGGWLSSRVESH